MTLEKSIDTEKAFSKLKDKQIAEVLSKVEMASSEAVEKFKALDEYSDKLCIITWKASTFFESTWQNTI